MIRRVLFIMVAALAGCAEPPPPPVDGEIIERAVKHAQDQTDGARRRQEAASLVGPESEG